MIAYAFTLFWLMGLLEFSVQLTVQGPAERTWGVSVVLFFFTLMGVLYSRRKVVQQEIQVLTREWLEGPRLFKILSGLTALLLLIALWQSFFPPHLNQELDAMNYHMTLPRQHLFRGNFSWIPWSVADLWPMPIQFGLAPAWFMGKTLNKWPQFFSTFNAFLLLLALGRKEDDTRSWRGWIPALAVFSTHGVMIQLGTAMLDLTTFYFALAALHSLINRRFLWSALHLAVLFTAKAFNPIQMSVVVGFAAGLILVTMRFTPARLSPEIADGSWLKFLKKTFLASGLLSLVLLSRSIYLGIKHVGTPIYPFFVDPLSSPGILAGAASHLRTRTDYGYGHGFFAFIEHLWLVSVPTQGVNNAYDYPLGLAWLLMLALMVFGFVRWWQSGRRMISLPAVLALAFWMTWWLGSHQSRWLYPVMALGWLSTLGEQRKLKPLILTSTLCLSVFLSLVSQIRSFPQDFHKLPSDVQREQEASIQGHETGPGILDSRDALFYHGVIENITTDDVRWIVPRP